MTEAFNDHFSARSADYAAYRPGYPAALGDYLASLPETRETALDLGCGSGQLSLLLTEHFDHVHGRDASAEQIAHAVPHPKVDYAQARAEATGLADASVDLLTVAQAAHWFDLAPFYEEVRRVVKPGGALALISYGVIEGPGPVGDVLKDLYANVLAGYWPPGREYVEAGYATMPFPFTETESPTLYMEADWPLEGLAGYIATLSSAMRAEKALGPEPFARFRAALAKVWGDPAEPKPFRWPLAIRAARL
ncbi:class I SAM-dependent methyltransferase [Methyloligella sp. 2.7D]|uniref:class I SAM-dependent methyltransferase n=1 Tax=unclassified Methyloligella TaxID=2625955 RepID=UPI00157CF279|nr:class I SAM-dependent methyltransferase [Methyloligella sp. GL2]QKP76233.1 class I SAM-dependent methyltransferase [Methyloligella sp. GL2]